MQATMNFWGNFNIKKLDKLWQRSIYCRNLQSFAQPLPIPEVCNKFAQLYDYMQERCPLQKDQSLNPRQKIFMALYNSLVCDDFDKDDYSQLCSSFTNMFSANKLQTFRQTLAAVLLSETAGIQAMRHIYPQLFADVPPAMFVPLPPAKGSAFVGFNLGGFFAENLSLRDEAESFEGCLKQLAEAAHYCAQNEKHTSTQDDTIRHRSGR